MRDVFFVRNNNTVIPHNNNDNRNYHCFTKKVDYTNNNIMWVKQ